MKTFQQKPTLWPSKRVVVCVEDGVFLLNTEPRFFALGEVHSFLSVVAVVGLVWCTVTVVAFGNYLIRYEYFYLNTMLCLPECCHHRGMDLCRKQPGVNKYHYRVLVLGLSNYRRNSIL